MPVISLLALGGSDRANLLVGLFASAGFLVLGIWITVKIFGQSLLRHEYHAFPYDVTGIRAGTPVLLAGYRVGVVTAIEYRWVPILAKGDANGGEQQRCKLIGSPPQAIEGRPYFKLTLAVEKDWPIREGSQLVQESPSLLGQPILALKPGIGMTLCAGSAIPFESLTRDQTAPDLTGLANNAKEVLATADALLKQVDAETLPRRAGDLLVGTQRAIAQVAKTADNISEFIEDPRLHATKVDTERAAAKLNKMLDDAGRLIRDLREAAPLLTQTVDKIRPPLSNAVTNLDISLQLTAMRLPAILSGLERSVEDLSGLLADWRANPSAAVRGHASKTPMWEGERPP
jgi:ABC-type transporter Mla subunit MlaD